MKLRDVPDNARITGRQFNQLKNWVINRMDVRVRGPGVRSVTGPNGTRITIGAASGSAATTSNAVVLARTQEGAQSDEYISVKLLDSIGDVTGDAFDARCIFSDGATAADECIPAVDSGVDILISKINTGTANITGDETIAFVDSNPDTITLSVGSFVDAGFKAGMEISVSGTDFNNTTYTIATVAAGTLTLVASDAVTDEDGTSATIADTGGWYIVNPTFIFMCITEE